LAEIAAQTTISTQRIDKRVTKRRDRIEVKKIRISSDVESGEVENTLLAMHAAGSSELTCTNCGSEA